MSEQVKFIDVRAMWRRVLLVVPVVLALVSAWAVARWCIGNTLASPEGTPDMETARSALRLAPSDPQAHYTLAVLARKSFEPEMLPEALRHYEEAVRLSPNNHLLWMDLGRVRGQAGDYEGGLVALRRAVELAPNYAEPRWHLGNLLLRAGRSDEAFAELRRAGDADPEKYRPQIFDLARRFYGDDLTPVINVVGDSPAARAQLATYLLRQNRLDDALRLWSGLDAAAKRENRVTGEELVKALFAAKRIRTLLDVRRDLASPEEAAKLTAERIANGGFEEDIAAAGKDQFGWQVTNVPEAQAAIDPRTSSTGARSLRLAFGVSTTLDFKNVSQLVVVQPRTRYRLTYRVRIDDLKSTSTLVTVVYDAAGDLSRPLTTSRPLPNGTSDWQTETIDFTTGEQTESVVVQLIRPSCRDAVCPIFGKVWYDDFDLQRIGDGNDAVAPGRRAR